MIVHDVTAFLDWLKDALSAPGVRCTGAAFAADGLLVLRFAAGRTRAVVRWGPPRNRAAPLAGLPYAFSRDGSPGGVLGPRLAQTLRARLRTVLERYHPAVLLDANGDETEVVFDRASVERLLRGFVQPGKTRCGALRCETIGFDGEAATLAFAAREGLVEYRLSPAGPEPVAGAGTTIAANRAFVLRRGRDDSGVPAADRRRLDRYLGYALHRCTHDRMTVRVFQDSIPLGSTWLWGNDLAFQFFCEKEHDCVSALNAMFTAEGRVGIVGHFDRECLNQLAFSPRPIQTFAVSRWYAAPREQFVGGLHMTYLGDASSILGATAAIDRVCSSPAARTFCDYGFVWHSCLPQMTGDSLQPGVVRPLDSPLGGRCKHILCEADVENRYKILQDFWRSMMERTRADAGRPRPLRSAVTLIGYGRRGDADLEELVACARQAGVEIVARILPSFTVPEARRMMRSAHAVMLFDETTARGFMTARPLLNAPVHMLTGPFGARGTEAWLRSLAALCGKGRAGAVAWRACRDRHAEELAALRRRAAAYRIAVAMGREQIPRVLDPYFNYGVPILPLLEELGFGLDILVYDRITAREPPPAPGEPPELQGIVRRTDYPYLDPPLRPDPAELSRVLEHPERHEVRTFDSFDGLMDLLRASPAALLYSEIYRDRRALCAGKLPFNLSLFGLGLSGLVRAGRRLLGLCETPFYRVHAARLGEP